MAEQTHKGVFQRLLQPWPCTGIPAFVVVAKPLAKAHCPCHCRAVACLSSHGANDPNKRETPNIFEKNPHMSFETQPWYLNWGWQDLQGHLAGPQLRWNTHALCLELGSGLVLPGFHCYQMPA